MADILRPELVWIEGRCYRVNDSNASVSSSLQEHDLYENEMYGETGEGDFEDEDYEVELLGDSKYSTSFHVPQHYMGYIIGRRGATRSRIERDTRTTIKIPKQGQSGNVIINGQNITSVKTARRRINMIIMSSRMKQSPTHFISIPVTSQQIIENFNKFKDDVLRECPDRGVEESLFISPHRLHVTIGVMSLMDNEERMAATKLFNDSKVEIIMPLIEAHLPLKLRVKGISYMNDDPTNINVLYATVQEENAPEGTLQKLADAVLDHFSKTGYINREKNSENVKIHVTLMNTKYARISKEASEESRERSRSTKRVTFDASRILKNYSNYDFGVSDLTEVHLSLMSTSSSTELTDSYYAATCVVNVL